MKSEYEKYKKNRIWNKVENALKTLEQNKDITILGKVQNITGYIVQSIIEDDLRAQKE